MSTSQANRHNFPLDNRDDPEVFDLIGIGFGPANLALSVALAEQNLANNLSPSTSASSSPFLDDRRHMIRNACFLESHHKFSWHPGMMIPGSRMQISFLKDLATLRNPSSPFTFLQYLHAKNRLVNFINRSTFAPTRREFADYLAWVAEHVVLPPNSGPLDPELAKSALLRPQPIQVSYGEWVTSVQAFQPASSGDLELLEVHSISTVDGSKRRRLCRNLIVSNGGVANIPSVFLETPTSPKLVSPKRIIHTSNFVNQIDQTLGDVLYATQCKLNLECSHDEKSQSSRSSVNRSDSSLSLIESNFSTDEARSYGSGSRIGSGIHSSNPKEIYVAVVGSGQSAVETLLETYNRIKSEVSSNSGSFGAIGGIKIDLIIRKGHLKPADDTPFVNEVFDPQSTDFFYGLKDEVVDFDGAGRRKGNQMNSYECQKSSRDFVLEEVAATNYSVVSPESIEALYELMYAQKVEEQSDRGSNLYLEPKIEIVRYTEVIDSERLEDGSLELRLKDILTRKIDRKRYDLVILGTGYSRKSWKSILFDICEGSTEKSGSEVEVEAEDGLKTKFQAGERFRLGEIFKNRVAEEGLSSPTNSIVSLSNGQSKERKPSGRESDGDLHDCEFEVKRNYRLDLPKTVRIESSAERVSEGKKNKDDNENEESRVEGLVEKKFESLSIRESHESDSDDESLKRTKVVTKKFRPTIWLQGCNESTHGISDSLLSVTSVRAGEILNGIQEEGWFGL